MTTAQQRGRKPSGLPLKDIQRRATAGRVKRLLSEGKARLDTFVDGLVLTQIDELKIHLGVKTQGDVIAHAIKELIEDLKK